MTENSQKRQYLLMKMEFVMHVWSREIKKKLIGSKENLNLEKFVINIDLKMDHMIALFLGAEVKIVS